MQYDLEQLEDLITVTLSTGQVLKGKITLQEIGKYRQLALTETDRIKKRMKSIIGRPVEDRFKEKYIQRNQQDIIVLKNVLVFYLISAGIKDFEEQKNETPLTNLYKFLLSCLRELLEYIEKYFQPYFNLDENVPESYLMRSLKVLRTSVKQLRKTFSGGGWEAELTDLALYPVVSLCNHKNKPVTYRHFLYIKKLVEELDNIEVAGKSLYVSFNPLSELLLYLNFNSGSYVTYTISAIVHVINGLPEQNEKIKCLLKWKKELNQVIPKPGFALKPNCVSLKEQLNGWIAEEIHYQETTQRLLSVAPVIKDDIINDEEKLHFSVSVNVLALFTRAAQDSALLLNKKGTLIFRNISKYCRTVNGKSPGAGSMDKKSHVAERAHKEKAIIALQEMIRRIQEY